MRNGIYIVNDIFFRPAALGLRKFISVPQHFVDLCADEDGVAAEVEPEHDEGERRQTAVHGDGVEVGDIERNAHGGEIPAEGGDERTGNLGEEFQLSPGEDAVHDSKDERQYDDRIDEADHGGIGRQGDAARTVTDQKVPGSLPEDRGCDADDDKDRHCNGIDQRPHTDDEPAPVFGGVADPVESLRQCVHRVGGCPQCRNDRDGHKACRGGVDLLQDLVQCRQQVFGKDGVHGKEQALLADRGKPHHLQQEYCKGKDGHQNKERRLRRISADLIRRSFFYHSYNEQQQAPRLPKQLFDHKRFGWWSKLVSSILSHLGKIRYR